MEKSESAKGRILLATDVVSRGIDFGDVEYIFQLDPPDDPDNFVHRIGRTARVNRKGYVRFGLIIGAALPRVARAELCELPTAEECTDAAAPTLTTGDQLRRAERVHNEPGANGPRLYRESEACLRVLHPLLQVTRPQVHFRVQKPQYRGSRTQLLSAAHPSNQRDSW